MGGDYQLLGMVRKRASIGRHQWFTDVAMKKAQKEIVVVAANDAIKKNVNSTHLETMRVSVEGVDQHIGQIKTIENEVVVKISKDKALIGTAHKEQTTIEVPGLTTRITSNKANKFFTP